MGDADPGIFESLPHRFRGIPHPSSAGRYRVVAGGLARDVVVSSAGCSVEAPKGRPCVTIAADVQTWRRIHAGQVSGIEAFLSGRLTVTSSIEGALRFEPMFDRPRNGALRYSIERVRCDRCEVSALVAGDPDAPEVLLLHGLGSSKASWLPVVPALAGSHRVVAVDLPGFGASSKPRAPYDAPWFARAMVEVLDYFGIQTAVVAGNSMGGRVAMEMGLTAPARTAGVVCFAPAAAFARRPALRLVRLARPEGALLAAYLSGNRARGTVRGLFADPDRVPETWIEAAVGDFLSTWKEPGARMAFAASARNIYLDEPFGERGFWTRICSLEVPARFVYGAEDPLISRRFAAQIERAVPAATVEVWPDTGHVPQVEHPLRSARVIEEMAAPARRRTGRDRAAR